MLGRSCARFAGSHRSVRYELTVVRSGGRYSPSFFRFTSSVTIRSASALRSPAEYHRLRSLPVAGSTPS